MGYMKMNTGIFECPNCNARISSGVPECPWCGAEQQPEALAGMRRKLSLGALITIVTLAGLLLWLMSLGPARQAR